MRWEMNFCLAENEIAQGFRENVWPLWHSEAKDYKTLGNAFVKDEHWMLTIINIIVIEVDFIQFEFWTSVKPNDYNLNSNFYI